MKIIAIFFYGVFASLVALYAHDSFLERKYGFDSTAVRKILGECEASLPRNKSCKVVISVKVKE